MDRIVYIFFIIFNIHQLLVAQNLTKGDLIIAGVNQLNRSNTCSALTTNTISYDNILFFTLKEIENGEIIIVTDNRYLGNRRFNTTEGFYQLERVGGKIEEASFFRIDFPYESVAGNPSFNGWKLIDSYYRINLNSTGDQIFVLNKGKWNNQGYFDGNFLFAFNSFNAWKSILDTSNSLLPSDNNEIDLSTFHFTPEEQNTSLYRIYNGPLDKTSKNEWLIRFLNPKNWISYQSNSNVSNCTDFVNKAGFLLNTTNKIENFVILENCGNQNIELETSNDDIIINFEWIKSDLASFTSYDVIGNTSRLSYQANENENYYVACKLTYQLKWVEDNDLNKSSTQTVLGKIYHVKNLKQPNITPILINL